MTPRDVECEGFNVTYTRIAGGSNSNIAANNNKVTAVAPHSLLESDIDRKVDESIESFLRSLSQIGPELLSVRWLIVDGIIYHIGPWFPHHYFCRHVGRAV